MLRPPHGLSGETQFEDEEPVWIDPNFAAGRAVIEDAVIVLLAGQVAEAVFWKAVADRYRPYVDSHRIDDEHIDELVAVYEFTPEQKADYLAHCRTRTEGYIHGSASQGAINEIAVNLANNLSIGRKSLDAILAKHGVSSSHD